MIRTLPTDQGTRVSMGVFNDPDPSINVSDDEIEALNEGINLIGSAMEDKRIAFIINACSATIAGSVAMNHLPFRFVIGTIGQLLAKVHRDEDGDEVLDGLNLCALSVHIGKALNTHQLTEFLAGIRLLDTVQLATLGAIARVMASGECRSVCPSHLAKEVGEKFDALCKARN